MVHRGAVTKKSSLRFKFIGEIIAELRKVVWLSRREALYLTGLVLLAAIVSGLFLGAFDFGFAQLVNKIFLGG